MLLIETFIELMIKAMDMEVIDWIEMTSWKGGKLLVMLFIVFYQAFLRWIPFIAVHRFKNQNNSDYFEGTIRLKSSPWFMFSSVFHVLLMCTFGFVTFLLNKAALPLYLLLFLASAEIIIYLIIGKTNRLFAVFMGDNTIIISAGYLNMIHLKELKTVEKKYKDEIYFKMKDGTVSTINTRLLHRQELSDFLLRLKKRSEMHNFYFANDIL